jgi:excisionase family DNA binding protein
MAAPARALEEVIAEAVADRLRPLVREELRAMLGELRAAAGGGEEELDTAAAAKHADVTPDTVRDWVRRRGLPARRPPGTRDLRIRRADLDTFLAAPAARRPPKEHGPVDLPALAGKMVRGTRRG